MSLKAPHHKKAKQQQQKRQQGTIKKSKQITNERSKKTTHCFTDDEMLIKQRVIRVISLPFKRV